MTLSTYLTSKTKLQNKITVIYAVLLSVPTALLGNSAASSDELISYANSLIAQRDYYRGISVLKQAAYFADDPKTEALCVFKIGEAYQKSRKYKSSVEYLERYIADAAADTFFYRAQMYLGASYLQLGRYDKAVASFSLAENMKNDGAGLVWAAYSNVQQSKFAAASDLLQSIIREREGEVIALGSQEILREIDAYRGSRQSARTASVLSALCPGLGQLYARHYYDAAQAFILVNSFAYMTYASYRLGALGEQSHLATILSAAVTGIFYYANILGAGRTAAYRNQRKLDNSLKQIRFLIGSKLGFAPGLGFSFSL